MATLINAKGVDISAANGNVDMGKIKSDGYNFVMIRCGFGNDQTDQDDSQFESNVRKAEEAGLPWGVYLYSYALNTDEAKSEAQHVIRLLKDKKPTLPVAFDMEDADGYKRKCGMPSNSTLVNICKVFLSEIKKAGYYPMLYASLSWLDNQLDDSSLLDNYDIWVAQWNSVCQYGGSGLGMWQYGSDTIDKNICYKDYPEIIKSGNYNNWGNTITTTPTKAAENTSDYSATKVVKLAKAEVGYKEKASNSQLNDKTANAGSRNWNKYAAYIDEKCPNFYNGKKNGYDWCDIFNDYIHIVAAGDPEIARKALYQPTKSTGAGCTYSAQFYRDNNAWTNGGNKPMVGDQIFFGERGNEYHTGIVVDVDSSCVYTIEGNSSEMVAERKYSLSDSSISGYGHPNYTDKTTTPKTSAATPSQKEVAPTITYKVRSAGRWLPEVVGLSDYAGITGTPITDVAIKVDKGKVKYRVHLSSGEWLPYVTGYDTDDYNNGYAGAGKAIDAIEIYYDTPSEIINALGYYKAKYRVSRLNGDYYDWQYDDEKTNGQDGYAGAFGINIDRLQITLSK